MSRSPERTRACRCQRPDTTRRAVRCPRATIKISRNRIVHAACAGHRPYLPGHVLALERRGTLSREVFFRRNGWNRLRGHTPIVADRQAKRRPRFYPQPPPDRMGPEGFEPPTNQLCVPLRLSPPLSGSWAGLSLHPPLREGCLPLSLYTFAP